MVFYLFDSNTINDEAKYAEFRAANGPLLGSLKFEMIGTEKDLIIYEGAKPAEHFVVIKFESKEDFENYYYSEGYQEAMKLRLAASETAFVMGIETAE